MENKIDIKRILLALLKRWKIIVIATVFMAFASYLYTDFCITPLYTSTAKLYVENKITTGDTITSSDLSAAQRLANTCSHIFKTDAVLVPMAETLKEEDGIVLSTGQLGGMISVTAIENSEILQVSVTTSSPELSRRVAEILVTVAPDAYKSIVDTGNMKRLNTNITANYHQVYPNVKRNVMMGAAAGFMISVLAVFVADLLDTKVKSNDDLYEIYGIPVFAEIIDFSLKSAGNKYKYGRYKTYYIPKKED
ncbi:MAG: YveK family protein [Oscillospiraceae bacterium]